METTSHSADDFKEHIKCPFCTGVATVDMFDVSEDAICDKCGKMFDVPNWIEIQHRMVQRFNDERMRGMRDCGVTHCKLLAAGMETDCEQIRKLNGKVMPIGEYPGLPLPGCLNECKCTVVATVAPPPMPAEKPEEKTQAITSMKIKCAHCGAENMPGATQCGLCGQVIYQLGKRTESTLGGLLGLLFIGAGLSGMLQYGFFFDVTVPAPKVDTEWMKKLNVEIPDVAKADRVVNWQLMNERTVMMVGSVGLVVFGGIIVRRK
jgi:ribosomal protein L40E